MSERKVTVTAPLYPNTKRQLSTLEQLDGQLLDRSQCLVEEIEGKVRRLIFTLFGTRVRARTQHPFGGDATVKEVAIKRDGEDWEAEITYEVPPRSRRRREGPCATATNAPVAGLAASDHEPAPAAKL
jgi:hypothetical protein